MICGPFSWRYNNGDELAIPILFRSEDDSIVDISGLTITAELWVRGVNTLTLTMPTGVEIIDTNPAEADDDDDQDPHGLLHLTEAQADDLPFGRIAYFKIVLVDTDDITVSTLALHLNKMLP